MGKETLHFNIYLARNLKILSTYPFMYVEVFFIFNFDFI